MANESQVDWRRFSELTKKLIDFNVRLSKVPVSGSIWEEVLAAVFGYMKYPVAWGASSHAKGVDIVVKVAGKDINISAKGGKISRDTLSLSSYRLTRFGFLGDMLKFLGENSKDIGVYFICARKETKAAVQYHVFKMDSAALVPEAMMNPINWEESAQKWELRSNVGFQASITKKMSNQLWYQIPLTLPLLETLFSLEIPNAEVGSGMMETLRSLDDEVSQQ